MAGLVIRPLGESFTIILINGHSPRVFNIHRKRNNGLLSPKWDLCTTLLSYKAQRSSNKKIYKNQSCKADLVQNSFD